ncbi:MAG TPA: hypothetical protein VHC22_32500 [Pirellulales bacterium]|nr:hypothetical protein [Pirellulales bacterium]
MSGSIQIKDANGVPFLTAPGPASGSSGALLVSSDGTKATYRTGEVGLTFYSTAAAVLLEIVGSASKTVRVKEIVIWGQAGTKFYTELLLSRCTAVSGGTPTGNVTTLGKHDKGDAAATVTINSYTAAAALGTGHVQMGARPLSLSPPAAGALGPVPAVWNFCQAEDKALILRGTGDVVEISNTITSLGTATWGYEVEWEEDNS